MKRREFVSLLGRAAAGWPLAARAQNSGIPVVGFLSSGNGVAPLNLAAFRQGLGQAGYVEGRNVAIEFRSAQVGRLPQLAADLVRRQVTLIVAAGAPGSVLAAKAATSTIPIVFVTAADPVKYGFVVSLNRPEGNATGVGFLSTELEGKRLNLLLELTPQATTIGYLSGPSNVPGLRENLRDEVLEAARSLGRQIVFLEVEPPLDFEKAFANLVQSRAQALVVGTRALFLDQRNRNEILRLAALHRVPTMYPNRLYAVNGGLMSYNPDVLGAYRRAGLHYVGQILKGAKASDLPVELPTKFELVINLKTAKALGLAVPRTLLALADEVIE
jgi:putative tryptophan/tyrosine transport system substrate-binding protein